MPSTTFASTGRTRGIAEPQHAEPARRSGASLIHETAVGQSVLGSCQRPDAVSAASASTGSASPTTRATADTWRQPKCDAPHVVEQRAHAEAGREREAQRGGHEHARRRGHRRSRRDPASAATRARTRPARASTRASPTRTATRSRSPAAPRPRRAAEREPTRARGPDVEAEHVAERHGGVERVRPSVDASAPSSENDHGGRSSTAPIAPQRARGRPSAAIAQSPHANGTETRTPRDEHARAGSPAARPSPRSRRARPRPPRPCAARRVTPPRGVTPRARRRSSAVTRTSAWNTNGASAKQTSGPSSPRAIASRPTGFADVRGRGDDRGQRRAGERPARAGTRPTCRAASRRRRRSCARARRARATPSRARPSSRRRAWRACGAEHRVAPRRRERRPERPDARPRLEAPDLRDPLEDQRRAIRAR